MTLSRLRRCGRVTDSEKVHQNIVIVTEPVFVVISVAYPTYTFENGTVGYQRS